MPSTKKPIEPTAKKSKTSSTGTARANSSRSSTTKKSCTTSSLNAKSDEHTLVTSEPNELFVSTNDNSSVSSAIEPIPVTRTLSYTQIDRYHRCPYHYWLTYVQHEEELLPWYVVKGIIAHELIADMLKGKAALTPEWRDIREIFSNIKNKVDEEFTDDMRREVAAVVHVYITQVFEMNHPKFVEYPVEVYDSIDGATIKWIGFIDCIEEDDTILDHKVTGQKHRERSPWQMNIYKRSYPAAKAFVFQELTPAGVNFIQVSTPSVDAATEDINHVVRQMLSEEYPKKKGKQCDYCYFKKTCIF